MPVIRAFETALNQGLLLESERHRHYFAFDTTELLKGDILKRYQAYQIGLANNFFLFDCAERGLFPLPNCPLLSRR